jgi:type II secretory pathway pseudopilin PulG
MRTGNLSVTRSCRGLTYLGLLLTIAIIGAVLASAGIVWHTQAQREREQELLFVGDQIRQAIGRYYKSGGARQFPQTLDELLRDPRDPGVVRHLRKLYHDPITSGEWGLVRGPGDRILGVYSQSDERPIRQANFTPADAAFEGREKYSEWQFVYVPKTTRRPPATPVSGPKGVGASPLLPGTKP